MFSLIISIISIALVAALAAATVYFGGAAFNKGSAGADASTFINAGQQIAGAFTLASADGHSPAVVADLNTGALGESTVGALDGEVYLAQIPSYKGTGLDGLVTEGNAQYSVSKVSDLVCAEIVKRADGVDADVVTQTTFKPANLFGCVKSTPEVTPSVGSVIKAGEHVAFYKVK